MRRIGGTQRRVCIEVCRIASSLLFREFLQSLADRQNRSLRIEADYLLGRIGRASIGIDSKQAPGAVPKRVLRTEMIEIVLRGNPNVRAACRRIRKRIKIRHPLQLSEFERTSRAGS